MPTHAIITSDQPTEVKTYAKKVILNDSQIKSLATAPIELVPAPSVGKSIFPLSAIISTHFSGGAYVADGDGVLEITLNNYAILDNIPNDSFRSLALLTQFLTGNAVLFLKPQQEFISSYNEYWKSAQFRSAALVENVPLMLDIDNQDAGDLTGGDAGNSMVITTFYIIIDL